jgi:2-polyprenyl-6-methoxyphenol hydroxylase-like FAD-dependent oxidoreductase
VAGARIRRSDGSRFTLRAGLLVGADGRTSRVAQAVGARAVLQDPHRIAVTYGYFGGIPNEGERWFFADGLQIGLIPTTGGLHCVFAACRPTEFGARFGHDPLSGICRSLAQWEPRIAAELSAAGPAERLRRYAGAPGVIRDCAGPGWALVGDAGYYKDPVTAHGITDALLDAARLARSQVTGDNRGESYCHDRNSHAEKIFPLTQRIASFDWDFEELTALHRDLNQAIRSECDSLVAMADPPSPVLRSETGSFEEARRQG